MPNCRVELFADATAYHPIVVIGQIAHIAAASDGGPQHVRKLPATLRRLLTGTFLLSHPTPPICYIPTSHYGATRQALFLERSQEQTSAQEKRKYMPQRRTGRESGPDRADCL